MSIVHRQLSIDLSGKDSEKKSVDQPNFIQIAEIVPHEFFGWSVDNADTTVFSRVMIPQDRYYVLFYYNSLCVALYV